LRVAALYDIHGNLPALEAVLAEVEAAAPDLVVIGGDVVAGPLPSETLDRLVQLGERARWVMGNADRMVIEAYDRGGRPADPEDPIDRLDAWVARQLTRDQRDRLASFEPSLGRWQAGRQRGQRRQARRGRARGVLAVARARARAAADRLRHRGRGRAAAGLRPAGGGRVRAAREPGRPDRGRGGGAGA
jgi:hypothetical protein